MTSRRKARLLIVALLVASGAGPLAAKKNVPEMELVFVPQQSVGSAEVEINEAMITHAFVLQIRDVRPGDKPAVIGTRTDDDDRRGDLTATNDVAAFLADSLSELAAEWGLREEAGAPLLLDVAVLAHKATEVNQAVGATFEADTRLSAKLMRDGTEVWSGTAQGDATRYGKKFSNANVNEVLSDALLEAFGALLSSPGLHDAWADQ